MTIKENIRKNAPDFFRVVFVSLLVGAVCGLVGTVFVKSIAYVTSVRENIGWILYLLPIFGLVLTVVYDFLKVYGVGTNHILKSVRSEEKVSPLLSVAIFTGTVFSHFGGASVGREGAALQLGGSLAEFLSRVFKIPEDFRRIVVMSGMTGLFSALFGTPFAAIIFVLEVAHIGKRCLVAIVPSVISSLVAFLIANKLGVEPESFPVNQIPHLTMQLAWKFVVIAILGALVSIIFVHALHLSEEYCKKIINNKYIRVFVGGAVIILLTKLLGTTDYNGGGIGVVHHVFTHGEVNYEAFLLKIVFTAISVGAGYKGGEIVPTIFIGGTLGGAAACLLGINPAFGAAVGITAMFCGATKAPFATVVLACELFGISGIAYYLIASAIGYALSGKKGLYIGRKTPFAQIK